MGKVERLRRLRRSAQVWFIKIRCWGCGSLDPSCNAMSREKHPMDYESGPAPKDARGSSPACSGSGSRRRQTNRFGWETMSLQRRPPAHIARCPSVSHGSSRTRERVPWFYSQIRMAQEARWRERGDLEIRITRPVSLPSTSKSRYRFPRFSFRGKRSLEGCDQFKGAAGRLGGNRAISVVSASQPA